jgi:S-adenosylmethionine decarboxylase
MMMPFHHTERGDPVRSTLHARVGSSYEPLLPDVLSPAPETRLVGGLPGRHLLIEMHGATGLDNPALIEEAFRRAIMAAGATLLHLHLHVFTPLGGVTGTASLAESHMSIHTWPEYGYAALDIFMCGECNPRACLPDLIGALRPAQVEIREILRGAGVPCSAAGEI